MHIYELCYLSLLKLLFFFDSNYAVMSERTTWKRKNALKDRAKWMHVQKQQETSEEQQESGEGPHSSMDMMNL